ncbi:MAG: 50S ribosomal protein L19 [Porphyromonas sp.]|nr:50S ribosomal protein L19 [Porphyromonas sp.]
MDLIKLVEKQFEGEARELPEFSVGDNISVGYRIREGAKERVQVFRGDVIRISGEGNNKRFTVRKISSGVGVERIFPINSPFIEELTVHKRGRVRRAKLYYLRQRQGKGARIRERVSY